MSLVLLINLKKRNDRLSKMESRLKDLDFTIIEAIEGNNLDSSISVLDGGLSSSEKACVASHIKAIKYFLSTKEKTCIILEDDVVFNDDFFTLARASFELPPELMVVKLETACNRVTLKRPYSRFLEYKIYELGSFHLGSAAYLITRTGAKIIIAELEKFILPSDEVIFKSFLNTEFSKNIYQMVPACCMQEHLISNVNDSDIEKERRLNHKKNLLKKTKGKSVFIFKFTREIRRILRQFKLNIKVLVNYRKYKRCKVRFISK